MTEPQEPWKFILPQPEEKGHPEHKLDPFLAEKTRKAAIYLVSHGPLREPRPIELQLMQIHRYIDLLGAAGAKFEWPFPEGGGRMMPEAYTFIDCTIDRHANSRTEWSRYPQLHALHEAVSKGLYEVVFISYQGGTWATDYIPFQGVLENAGAKVLNASSAEADELVLARLGDRYASITDGSDMACFFPGLASDILQSIFPYWELDRQDFPAIVREYINRKKYALDHDSPYRSSNWPFVNENIKAHAWERKSAELEAERVERRKRETLFLVHPDKKPMLLNEGNHWSDGEPRPTEAQLQSAEERLFSMGFSRIVDGQTVSYQRVFGDVTVFADPRSAKGIRFAAYTQKMSRGRHPKLTCESLGDFLVLDTWKKDLKSKVEQWVNGLPHPLS